MLQVRSSEPSGTKRSEYQISEALARDAKTTERNATREQLQLPHKLLKYLVQAATQAASIRQSK